MDEKQTHEREHFFGAAKLVAAITLLSRILGMIRDMAITWLGASRLTDAFQLAFAVPNLFRRLFGEGALSAAFVPVFTETNEKDGFDRARGLLSNALSLLAVFLLALMLLILAGLLVWQLVSPPPDDRRLLLMLTAVMLPFMVTICLLALGSAALNCRGHFAYPAFAPILLNIFMIAAAVAAPRLASHLSGQLTIIAASVTAAGVLQLVLMLAMLRRQGFTLRMHLRPIEPGMGRMLRLMGPMLLGFGLLQISSFFDYYIAWVLTAAPDGQPLTVLGLSIGRPLSEGVLVRYNAATRLYQFPMGVLAISLGVAVFPLLSRYAARGDMVSLRSSVNRAIRLSVMEGLAAGTGLLVLAEPIIELIFRHGQFTQADAQQSAFILKMYVLGMWAYCSYQIFLRAFYASKDTRTPLKISCGLVVLYMTTVLVLIYTPLGAGAFGVATAVSASVNTILLAAILRRRIGPFGGRAVARSIGRTLVACLLMAAAVLWIRCELSGQDCWIIPDVLGFGPLVAPMLGLGAQGAGMVVLGGVITGAAVFVLTMRLLRAPELAELFGSLRRRKE